MPMTPALVLDTNTVLALWMFRDPGLEALRMHIEAGHCLLHGREDALDELQAVLGYAQFGLVPAARSALFDAYRQRLQLSAPALPAAAAEALALPQCRDPDDQKFLEIARDAGAAFLLTRDRLLLRLARHRLLRARFAILTPENYLRQLSG